jgi:hypothetical protein
MSVWIASTPPSIALIVPETIAQFRDTQNSCSSVLQMNKRRMSQAMHTHCGLSARSPDELDHRGRISCLVTHLWKKQPTFAKKK